MQYSGWTERAGAKKTIPMLPMQKVLVVDQPNGTRMITPREWPVTATDNWLCDMAEAHARNITTPEDLDSFINGNKVAIDELLANQGRKIKGFNKYQIPSWSKENLEKAAGFGKSFAHQLEHGFEGNQLNEEEKQLPVMTNAQLMHFAALLGNMVAAGRATLK